MDRKNGFTLLELMMVLGIITIVGTIAVPRIQVWNARHKGMQAVMEIVSDYSKARSIAGYTIVDNSQPAFVANVDDSGPVDVYMGKRLQTGMHFREDNYVIYQCDMTDLPNDCKTSASSILKVNKLPKGVTINSLMASKSPSKEVFNSKSIIGDSRLYFNAYGMVFLGSQGNGGAGALENCGGKGPFVSQLAFSAIIRSKVAMNDEDSIWYRVYIGLSGDYEICSVFGGNSKPNFTSDGEFVDM